MSVRFLFSTLAILLVTLTVFTSDTIADSESTSNADIWRWMASLGIALIAVGVVYFVILPPRTQRAFLKAHRRQLWSEDPKVLLELSEKCEAYLKDQYSAKIENLSQQAKTKRAGIQSQVNFETFKSEISEDGSHPAVVSTLKEKMHNPDSFQHVSSDYEIVEKYGRRYYKIVMTFRATNTFNALVLQTCYFLLDADNQITLVGSPDNTESSPVNTAQLSASVDAAASAFEGVAALADLLSFFSSEE